MHMASDLMNNGVIEGVFVMADISDQNIAVEPNAQHNSGGLLLYSGLFSLSFNKQ